MLHHLVLISVLPDTPEEKVTAMVEGLRALPAQIDVIDTYEVGRDLGLAEGNAAVAIRATFASPEDLDAYVVHPAHQAVVTELIRPVASNVARAQVPA